VEEESVPVHDGVRTACEMLGIDPLSIGNEGKAVLGVVKERAEEVLKALRRTREGREAAIIGEATTDVKGVVLHTTVGGKRILEQPAGDPIPRIC
jgi:hydrogenase expression/formation protein HypE